MATRTYTYYDANNNPLQAPRDMQGWQWAKEMPEAEPVKCRAHSGLPYVAGYTAEGERVAAVRVVAYKNQNPSKHVCGARCRTAKGGNCECECGGEYHGVDA